MARTLLFTYGTLQPGSNLTFFEQNHLDTYLIPIGRATVHGDLVHIRNRDEGIDYPGLVNPGASQNEVHGTVFEITHPEVVLPIMDEHEEYTPGLSPAYARHQNFYERTELTATLTESKESVSAMAYVLNRESEYYTLEHIEEVGPVPSGDWLAYIRKLVS